MKILIADDDLSTLRLLTETVKGLGHQVVTFTDGASALECLEAPEPPGLALLDWVMPKLNGPEICRALKHAAAPSEAYLILVTARTSRLDMTEGLRSGADDYVTKPFNPLELASRIEIGIRVSCLERRVRSKVREVESLQARVATLESLLPCASCGCAPDPDEVADALTLSGLPAPACEACASVGCGR